VKDDEKRFPLLRYYSVFNIAQCDGIGVPTLSEVDEKLDPIKECEEVVDGMPSRPLITHGRVGAFYNILRDEVCVPIRDSFESAEAYYSTLFHELTHATGHRSRLDRPGISQADRFGSDLYSREELIAEMGAAFLCGHCGISNRTVDQSASYIQSWLMRLKNDRKLVVQAAASAQKACDFILGHEVGARELADGNESSATDE